jgi:hypothetical protein
VLAHDFHCLAQLLLRTAFLLGIFSSLPLYFGGLSFIFIRLTVFSISLIELK